MIPSWIETEDQAKAFLDDNIGQEWSKVGTSHGATELAAREMPHVLANLSQEEITKLIMNACWDSEALVEQVLDLIDRAAALAACEMTQ